MASSQIIPTCISLLNNHPQNLSIYTTPFIPENTNSGQKTRMPSSVQFRRATAASTTSFCFPKPNLPDRETVPETVAPYHTHSVGPNQCWSYTVQQINAPVESVWSVVRRFDEPQIYKHFIKSCQVISGDGERVGTVREVHVVSGLPAESSTERLEILDDERHVMSFSMVGGDHRLMNYRSVTTLHETELSGDGNRTVVVESYVVDAPAGNTKEETRVFVDTIVRCNLQSLAQIAENMSGIRPS